MSMMSSNDSTGHARDSLEVEVIHIDDEEDLSIYLDDTDPWPIVS